MDLLSVAIYDVTIEEIKKRIIKNHKREKEADISSVRLFDHLW